MKIPEEHRTTIHALVEADPEVAQATCDIPHLAPTAYLRKREEADLPYCGCFVGVYAWMLECKRGVVIDVESYIPTIVEDGTRICEAEIRRFALWCSTVRKDEEAVCYARSLLS